MTERDPWIDPEAEALLLEVAKDPRSRLLKVERPRALSKVVASGGDLLVKHKTGLTNAEKKLLEVYREEAAYLLRLAYFELWQRAGVEHNQGRAISEARDEPLQVGVSNLASLLLSIRATPELNGPIDKEIKHALALISMPSTRWVPLAQSSLKFAPSSPGESYVGMELMISGDLVGAARIYQSLLEKALPVARRARYLNTLALIRLDRGEVEEGMRCYRRAAKVAPENATAAFSWLWSSIHRGNLQEVEIAASHVDSLWPEPSAALSSLLRAVYEQRARGYRAFAEPSTDLLSKIRGRFGPSAETIIGAVPQ